MRDWKKWVKLAGVRATMTMTQTQLDGDIDLGDVVGGKDYLTGISMQKPISRKIWTVSSGKEKITYKLEGET